MANEQNLIPYGKGNRSESEEREMRSRGGKRSGETRRRKELAQGYNEQAINYAGGS